MPETERYEHFQIVRREDGSIFELGRGAMGVTYKAMDTNLHSPVALKVINAKYLHNETARQRFLLEARATAQLRHRNVASVFHLGATSDNCFYAMEFIDGITVDAMVRREGPMELDQALNVTLQVSRALVAAERHELVHRDIKPSNLMLIAEDGELVVKVIDFGLARRANSVPEGGFQGSPQFASPEQIEQKPTDSRSDIYSLGATLWFMLTGRPLFTGNIHEVFEQQISKPPPIDLIRNFPPLVVKLLESMLAKDPAKRPATASDLRGKVEQCVDALRNTGSSVVLMMDEHGKEVPHLSQTTAATHSIRPAIGSLLAGRYRITRDLGIRSAGRVFQTVDVQTKKAVCVNLLDPELEQFAGGILQIQEDATRLKLQGHTHLLQVYNVQVNEGVPLLAVEWANGFPLIDLLRVRGKINPVEAMPILIQTARAVDFCAEHQFRGLLIGLNQILIHFPGDPVDEERENQILKLPVHEWPPFIVKLHALGPSRQDVGSFTWDGGVTLDTFTARSPTGVSATELHAAFLKNLAEVAYELFGGLRGVGGYASASEAVRYTPLPALSEQGNAVLRRGLSSESGFPTAVAFCDALRTAVEAEYVPSMLRPPKPEPEPAKPDQDVTLDLTGPNTPSVTARTGASASATSGGRVPSMIFKPATLEPPRPAEPTPPPPAKEPAPAPAPKESGEPTPVPPPPEKPAKERNVALILGALGGLGIVGAVAGYFLINFIADRFPQGSPTPTPAPTATPEPTPVPTPTAVPTSVPTPTATPTSAPTPSPTPRPTPPPTPTPVPTVARAQQFDLALAALTSAEPDLLLRLPRVIDLAAQYQDVEASRNAVEFTLDSIHNAALPVEKLQASQALLEKLAADGSPGAMLLLGDLQKSSNPAAASEWFQKAATAGSASAMVEIGLMLARSESVENHLKKAISWFEKAAALNHPEGQFLLAECYYYGTGVKKDPDKALSLLRPSVEAGNARAMDLMGAYYVAAPEGVRNYAKAADLFNRAQTRGNLNALANLGVLYVKGQGVKQDPAMALEMFKRGAEAGHPACMYFYGACYEDGIGVEKDIKEAERWYVKAAKGGNAYAIQWCKEHNVAY